MLPLDIWREIMIRSSSLQSIKSLSKSIYQIGTNVSFWHDRFKYADLPIPTLSPLSWSYAYHKMKTSKDLAIKFERYASTTFNYFIPTHNQWSLLFINDITIPHLKTYVISFKCKSEYILELNNKLINHTIHLKLTKARFMTYITLLFYYHDHQLKFSSKHTIDRLSIDQIKAIMN